MNEYISKEFMLKNLEADKMNNAEHCEPVTVQIMERFIRYVKEFPAADVQPVKHSRWIPMNDGTYNAYCENCGHERGSKAWNKADYKYCPYCGTRMDLDSVTHDRCSNYMDCDGSCFIDDTPCGCGGDIEKCKGR